jgi:hypothetical protein
VKQHITVINEEDHAGNPDGGHVQGIGLEIRWQKGPLGRGTDRAEPNGAFVETVLEAARQRIVFYNGSKFRCRENSLAITHIEEALHWLKARTEEREARGVEGTHSE